MTRRRSFILALAALAAAASCARPQPSVVLVSIDSLRADDIDAQVDGRSVTPRLTGLAAESVRFTRAYAAAPWTTPAMMSVMTGLPAPAHGVEEHDRALASSVEVLAERFKAAGYRTAAFVPASTLRGEFGFSRGFDIFDLEDFGHLRLSSPALVGKALNQIDKWSASRQPFFVWIHLWDPHYNYIPPPPYDAAFARGVKPASDDVLCLKWAENPLAPDEALFLRGRQQGEVLYTDKSVGDLLDHLGRRKLDDRTIVAVLGDHGEAFQEHGWLGHTNRVDEEVIHVPLMVRWTGRVKPAVESELVETAQLGRTLLELAGIEADDFGLAPALPGATPYRPAGDASVISQTIRQACLTALTGPRYKYVVEHRTCAESLFDLAADPGEKRNLAQEAPAILTERREALRDKLHLIDAAKIPRAGLPADIVDEAQAALRSLGYLGGGAAAIQSACPFAPRTSAHDTFGDLATEACPLDGPRRCLAPR